VNHVVAVQAAHACSHVGEGCGYPSPSIQDFYFRPLFSIGNFHFDKPMLLVLLSTIIVVAFFWAAFWKPQKVPRGVQNLGELGILFVRDQILRPQLGKKGDNWLPFLCALFFFIWVNNIFGIIPILYFPATSRFEYPAILTAMVWVLYMGIGMWRQGPLRYLKNLSVPSGSPWWILPLLAPIDFLSNVFIRPFTLSVRHLVPADTQDSARVLSRVLPPAHRADRAGTADPAAAGVHLHRPDRVLHLRRVRIRALIRPPFREKPASWPA
jgi:F-type H+-transporting ATPase subunit a